MLIIDFVGYARKVPTKKAKLKTCSYLLEHLWLTFTNLSKGCTRIDIIFDLYHDKSIKGSERKRRYQSAGILTKVTRSDQPFPVEMDKFWSLSECPFNSLLSNG